MNTTHYFSRKHSALWPAAALCLLASACGNNPLTVEQLGLSNAAITATGDTATYGSTDFQWQPNHDLDFEIRIGGDCATGILTSGAGASGTALGGEPVTSTIDATADQAALSEGDNTVHVCAVAGPESASVLTTTVILDNTPPDAPAGSAVSPTGPANNNSPHLTGSAEADAAIEVFSDGACSVSIGTGSADNSGAFDVTATVTDNTETTFRVQLTDGLGNLSGCLATAVSYTEDSITTSPVFSGTTPGSPAASTNPAVNGTAEAGATVTLYTNNTCTSAVAGSGTATGGNFSIGVTVGASSTTTFYGTAQDIAGNTAACSATGTTYVQNPAPVFSNLPGSVNCTPGDLVNSFTAAATDADSLTFSEGAGSTCDFAGQGVAAGGGVSFTCGVIFTNTCTIEIQVTDGISTVTDYLTVNPTNVWFVDGAVGTSGAGTSWAAAKKTIQEGVNAASSGEWVWIAEGTYTSSSATTPVIAMKAGVNVYGGLRKTETKPGDRLVNPYGTVLNGQSATCRVVTAESNARLDGVTVTSGDSTGTTCTNASIYTGAGIYVNNKSNFTLANCVVRDNHSSGWGGGVSVENSSPGAAIDNCLFKDNSAGDLSSTSNGGALMVVNSSAATVTNSDFITNTTSNSSAGGGGIYVGFGCTLKGVNLTFIDNASNNVGAAVTKDRSGVIDLVHVSATGNDNGIGAFSSNNDAGGSFTIENSAVYANAAVDVADFGAGLVTIDHTCYGSLGTNAAAAATNSVSLAVTPFVEIASGQMFLNQSSGCVGAGSNTKANTDLPAWASLTTNSTLAVDGGTVDAGRHYDPAAVLVKTFTVDATNAAWTTSSASECKLMTAAGTVLYTVPPGNLASGSTAHGQSSATDLRLRCIGYKGLPADAKGTVP